MAMAASQARFLQLTARMSNVEYQGQQINQERTGLSNESAQAYNSLLGMNVPTPPSKTDFTKTVYEFKQGTYNYEIDSVYPNTDGVTYTIGYIKSGNVIGLQDTATSATIRKGTNPDPTVTGYAPEWLANGNQLYEVNASFVHDGKTGEQLFAQLFNNTPDVSMSDFYVYLEPNETGTSTYKFIKKEDIDGIALTASESGMAHIWRQDTITSNEKLTTDQGQVVFDTNGRMTAVVIEGKEYALSSKTETDEAAYEDAYNKYEYEKYLYNQNVAEINAEISIIHIQDKKLELQLEQLDTERTTLTTEIEAVEKVLGENIDRTYKTFNG